MGQEPPKDKIFFLYRLVELTHMGGKNIIVDWLGKRGCADRAVLFLCSIMLFALLSIWTSVCWFFVINEVKNIQPVHAFDYNHSC